MRSLMSAVAQAPASRTYGRVSGVQGLLVEVAGTADALAIGTRLTLEGPRGSSIAAEVGGLRDAFSALRAGGARSLAPDTTRLPV